MQRYLLSTGTWLTPSTLKVWGREPRSLVSPRAFERLRMGRLYSFLYHVRNGWSLPISVEDPLGNWNGPDTQTSPIFSRGHLISRSSVRVSLTSDVVLDCQDKHLGGSQCASDQTVVFVLTSATCAVTSSTIRRRSSSSGTQTRATSSRTWRWKRPED